MRCEDALERAFRTGLLDRSERLLVACSGGRDSIALLHALVAVRGPVGIAVGTVNHGLHSLAHAACQAVADHARKIGVDCYTLNADPSSIAMGRGIEDGARNQRLALLEGLANELELSVIVTAHHAGDQAETVFMRLLKGTGWRGVSGIPQRRGKWRRPWLEVSPKAIDAYVEQGGLHFVEDPTNVDTRYDRNRFRAMITAAIDEAVDEGWEMRVARSVRRLNLEREGALEIVEDSCKLVTIHSDHVAAQWGASAPSPARRVVIIRMAFAAAREAFGERCPPWIEQHIDVILDLAEAGDHERGLDIGAGWRAEIVPGGLILSSGLRTVDAVQPVTAASPGVYDFGRWRVRIESSEYTGSGHWVSAPQMPLPWTLRLPHEGERFCPRGAPGRKRIRRIWSDLKVPRSERNDLPVLDAGGTVVWVAKIRSVEGSERGESSDGFLISLLPRVP